MFDCVRVLGRGNTLFVLELRFLHEREWNIKVGHFPIVVRALPIIELYTCFTTNSSDSAYFRPGNNDVHRTHSLFGRTSTPLTLFGNLINLLKFPAVGIFIEYISEQIAGYSKQIAIEDSSEWVKLRQHVVVYLVNRMKQVKLTTLQVLVREWCEREKETKWKIEI